MERITEVLLKYNQSPWSLSEDERKIVERLEMEPEWFLKEGYSDEEFLTETKKKGEPFYEYVIILYFILLHLFGCFDIIKLYV